MRKNERIIVFLAFLMLFSAMCIVSAAVSNVLNNDFMDQPYRVNDNFRAIESTQIGENQDDTGYFARIKD